MAAGSQYRSAIYFYDDEQKQAAQQRFEEVNQQLSKSAFRRVLGTKVVTELEPGTDYYIAEKVCDLALPSNSNISAALSDLHRLRA